MNSLQERLNEYEQVKERCENEVRTAKWAAYDLVVPVLEALNIVYDRIDEVVITGKVVNVLYSWGARGSINNDAVTIPLWVVGSEDQSTAIDSWLAEREVNRKKLQVLDAEEQLKKAQEKLEALKK